MGRPQPGPPSRTSGFASGVNPLTSPVARPAYGRGVDLRPGVAPPRRAVGAVRRHDSRFAASKFASTPRNALLPPIYGRANGPARRHPGSARWGLTWTRWPPSAALSLSEPALSRSPIGERIQTSTAEMRAYVDERMHACAAETRRHFDIDRRSGRAGAGSLGSAAAGRYRGRSSRLR